MRPPPSASSPLAPFADARKPKVSWAETAGEEGGIRLPKPDEGVHVPLRSLNPHWAEVPMDPARRSLDTGKSRPERFPRGCGFAICGCAALQRKERWGLTHGAPTAARVSRGRGANLGLARRRGASSVGWAALA